MWGAAAQNQGFRNSPGIISTVPGLSGSPATYLATDAVGNIYYSDSYNNKVNKLSPSGTITTIAGNGSGGYSGDGGPATNAKLFTPIGILFDTIGNLYIADINNALIRKVDTAGIIRSIAGIGTWYYTGDG